MHSLETLLSKIERGSLLPDSFFTSLDADRAIGLRDQVEFETRWASAFEAVEAAWKRQAPLVAPASLVDRIREEAFKRAFHGSGGHHDFAASVSDDFDLICRKRLTDIVEPFVDQLEAAYHAHRFPS